MEKRDSFIVNLRSGHDVVCKHCKKGVYLPVPFSAPPDKAHCFRCAICENTVNIDAPIDIE